MAKGILIVESQPSSPDRVEEYNQWYAEVHLPEVCAVPGFVSAARFEPADGEGPYVAIYQLDLEDLSTAVAALGEAVARGAINMSEAISMDPPPSIRLLELTATHEPALRS